MISSITRSQELKSLDGKTFDLIVVGGGITGAGIALDAASRGLSVAVFEKQDFAQGTSSRSTKLVHGGLRYLEHMEFAIVRAVGRERRIVHENAMHIVLPEKMILPIIEGGSLGEFTTNIALKLYDFLAGVKKTEQRKMMSKEEVINSEPLLESDFLKGGAMYYEYKTDDARLTIEIAKKAVEIGAKMFNYAEVTEFLYEIAINNKFTKINENLSRIPSDNNIKVKKITDENNFKINGVKVHDIISENEISVYAKYVVNATGIWVDKMRKKDNPKASKRLHITKGIHIVVPKTSLPLKHSIYFDTGDNRMVFAIPRFDVVYIGTTDTNYENNYEHPDIELKDVQYLIDAVNNISPKANLKIENVISAWSGLRPLIHEEGKSPSELSRKDEIFYSKTGLISIAGGKLTGYRLMAKKILEIIKKRMKLDYSIEIEECKTEHIKLSGGEFDFNYSMLKLIEYADSKYDEAKHLGISIADFKKLFYRYGKNIDKITNKAYEFYNENKNFRLSWIKAEVWYTINYEGVYKLTDFFIRRTGMIHFLIKDIVPMMNDVADYMQEIFSWNEEQKNSEIQSLKNEIEKATIY